MAGKGSYAWAAALGFLALGGGFGVAAVLALRPVAPPAFAPTPAPEAVDAAEGRMLVYVPIEEQIAVAVAEQPKRVMLTLAVTLRGTVEELIGLKAAVDEKRPAILAEMLIAAQGEVVKSTDPATLLKSLPGPLRAAVNRVAGTDALPEPVEEVLIIGLVTQ